MSHQMDRTLFSQANQQSLHEIYESFNATRSRCDLPAEVHNGPVSWMHLLRSGRPSPGRPIDKYQNSLRRIGYSLEC